MKPNSFLHLVTSTLALFLLSPSAAAGQSFQRTVYSSPDTPSDLFVADLNHDGKPDLVAGSQVRVPVFLNRGNGIFDSASFSAGGVPVSRVVAADFSGSGIVDIDAQICTSGGPTIAVLSPNGAGGFMLARDFGVVLGSLLSSCTGALALITLADVTVPSLMISTSDDHLTILENNGSGLLFQQQNVFGAPGTRLSGATAGNFNGDQLQDIAAVSTDADGHTEHIVIFFQNPDGSFQPPVTVFTMDALFQVVQAVDFNGTESDDLVVPFLGGPDKRAGVVALTNVGPGEFRSKILLADPFYTSAGQKATAIHSRGKHDEIRGILAPFSPEPSTGDSVFAFFPAHGDTWGKPIYFDVPNGKGAQAVVTADFNGDGRPDFAGVDENNELLVFLNNTTKDTCAFPSHAGVHICSPDSDSDSDDTSRTSRIHASANGGALPIVDMKAFIDDKLVFESDMNTLDASVPVDTGRHVLTVSASDRNGKVYQSSVGFHVR